MGNLMTIPLTDRCTTALHDTAASITAHRDQLRTNLSKHVESGALVEFSGHVRQSGDLAQVVALEIDYYAPLTQPALNQLAQTAMAHWPLNHLRLLHRVGRVALGELIVWVAAASAHRADAFAAASFVMDRLKTDVPFWKKEIAETGEGHWVQQKASDRHASAQHHALKRKTHRSSHTDGQSQ